MQPQIAKHRAQVARRSQLCAPDDPQLLDARRDLRAACAEDYIRKLVDAAPPLPDSTRARLAALLRPAGTAT